MTDRAAATQASPPVQGPFGIIASDGATLIGEIVLVGALFVALVLMLLGVKLAHVDQIQGDSAAFFQATENIASRGVAVSQVQAIIVDYYRDNKMVTTPVARVAADPLAFARPTPAAERSLLVGHAYYVLYPLALLVRVFPVSVVLMACFVASFAGMVLAAYFVLRTRAVSPIAATLFALLIVSHASWSESLLWGQFYPDRLFVLTGFLLMCLAAWDFGAVPNARRTTFARCGLLAAAVLCALVNERGALTAGLFLVAYVALYWAKPGNDRYVKLVVGVALLAYGYAIMKFVIPTNSDYGSFLPTNLAGVMYIVQRPFFFQTVGLFFLVSLPMLAIASFEWRAAAIAVFLMLPNVFGNIGGAEKLGWSTHYHSFYFPALVWAAMLGFSALCARARRGKFVPAALAATGAAIAFGSMIDPYSFTTLSITPANMASNFIPRFNYQATTFLGPAGRALSDQAAQLRRLVPEGTEVSTVQLGMPSLYHNRLLQHYPNDLDHARYAVLGAQQTPGGVAYNGAVSYVGGNAQAELDKLAVERMRHDGYDVEHPTLLPLLGIAVVRRDR